MNASDIIGLAGNAATGGVLGLIGSIGSGVVSIFQAKTQMAHDEAMGELNLRLVAANSDAASKLSSDQLKTMSEQQAGQAFTASQASCAGIGCPPPAIAGALALWRPILTAALLTGTAMYFPRASEDMQVFIIEAWVTATFTAISWWFGSRQMEKFIPSKPVLNKT